LPVGYSYQGNLKFETKKGGPHILLGAKRPSKKRPSINPITPEIIRFQKRLYLNHSPYALREQKNRERVKREIQQWMYCINVQEQFDASFMTRALIFS